MAFEVNDRVEVMDDTLYGKVVKVDGNSITIETSEGFLLNYNEAELIKIGKSQAELLREERINIDEVLKEKQSPPKHKSFKIKPKERSMPAMEIDLHIEKLVNSKRGMNNYDILNLQLETAKRQIEFARKKRIQKIVFIHGVGEGVLKAELDYLLNGYDFLKFYDANFQQYGVGATEVYFFQNI